jgi:phospholipid-binding lipoprotein MlaA
VMGLPRADGGKGGRVMRRMLAGLLVSGVVSMSGAVGVARVGAAEPVASNTGQALGAGAAEEAAPVEYDPWKRFNKRTFAFNHSLDSHVIKPAAKGYDKVVPNWAQRAVMNMAANVGSVRRIASTGLQGRFNDMGQEFGRFFINTIFGLGGFVNAAPSFGVKDGAPADMGQTFGVWGAGPGPYLVVPFLPPLTLRDAFGFAVDTALDPVTWVAPIGALVGATGEKTVNTRSLNLELYEGVEETTLDLYTAVESAYLQQRDAAVLEGRARGLFGHGDRPGPGTEPAR